MSTQPTIDEIYDLIEERIINNECPCCGTAEWERPQGRTFALLRGQFNFAGGFRLFAPDPRTGDQDWGEVIFAFYCRRCGYIRSHFYTWPQSEPGPN